MAGTTGLRSWGGEGNVAGWLHAVRVDYKMIRILSTILKKIFFLKGGMVGILVELNHHPQK